MSITLNAGIGHDNASLPLSGVLPPAIEYVLIDAEQLRIVGQSSDTTPRVVRGANGTVPAAHNSGATVEPLYIALTATPGTLAV